MKVYISADIEGVTGIAHWDEADPSKPDYDYFRQQMTAEVAAACEACLEAGASQVWVKDAHATGRNLIPSKLPREVRLVRGWSGHPFMMAQELDESFDAMMMIGYHSRAGSDANPLAHTISSSRVAHVKINEQSISECLMHAYAGAWVGVPLVFLSGDEGLCQEMQTLNPHMVTNAVMRGVGHSTVSIHPELALQNIRRGVREALQGDLARCRLPLPEYFSVEVAYKVHWHAYRASFFPGASSKEPGVALARRSRRRARSTKPFGLALSLQRGLFSLSSGLRAPSEAADCGCAISRDRKCKPHSLANEPSRQLDMKITEIVDAIRQNRIRITD